MGIIGVERQHSERSIGLIGGERLGNDMVGAAGDPTDDSVGTPRDRIPQTCIPGRESVAIVNLPGESGDDGGCCAGQWT